MSVQITIPAPLRRFTGEEQVIEVHAETINEVLDRLNEKHPGLRSRLCEDNGELRRFFNIYVNGEDVRFLDNLRTKISEGTEVSIIPAISGG